MRIGHEASLLNQVSSLSLTPGSHKQAAQTQPSSLIMAEPFDFSEKPIELYRSTISAE